VLYLDNISVSLGELIICQLLNYVSNLSKAHVMHDSSSPATLAISVCLQQ